MLKKRIILDCVIGLFAVLILLLVYKVNEKNYSVSATKDEVSPSSSVVRTIETYPESTEIFVVETQTPTSNSRGVNETQEQISSKESTTNAIPDGYQDLTSRFEYIKPTQEPTFSVSEIANEPWKSFRIELNSNDFSFPFSANEIKKIGYEFEKEGVHSLDFGQKDNPVVYKNGDKKQSFFSVFLTNDSDPSADFYSCKVIGMNLRFENLKDDLSVSLSKMPITKDTNPTELVSIIGQPTAVDSSNGYETYSYSNENNSKRWVFGFESDRLIGIEIYVN